MRGKKYKRLGVEIMKKGQKVGTIVCHSGCLLAQFTVTCKKFLGTRREEKEVSQNCVFRSLYNGRKKTYGGAAVIRGAISHLSNMISRTGTKE